VGEKIKRGDIAQIISSSGKWLKSVVKMDKETKEQIGGTLPRGGGTVS